MNRIIYILILISAFAFNLELKANDKKIKLDSIVTLHSKEVFEYNEAGYLINLQNYIFDPIENDWKENSKQTYVYNENKSLILISKYFWSANLNYWNNNYKIEIEYDNNKNIISEVSYEYNFNKNEWFEKTKMSKEYDKFNNVIDSTYLEYNFIGNYWIGRAKQQMLYNEENKLILYIFFTWDFQNQNWQKAQISEYLYSDNLLKTINIFKTSKNPNELVLSFAYEYIYFNRELKQLNQLKLDTLSKRLEITYSTEYFFNTYKNTKSSINQRLNKNKTTWQYISKVDSIYGNEGNLTELINYKWDTNTSEWINEYKEEFLYNKNNYLLSKKTYNWDLNANYWNSYIFNLFEYDALNNLISEEDGFNRIEYFLDNTINFKSIILPNIALEEKLTNKRNRKIYFQKLGNDSIYTLLGTTKYYYSDFNPTSVENEVALNPDILIFPNPSSEQISLDLGGVEFADLVVYDFLGNEIMSIPSYTNKSEIDISNLSIGTYTIQVQTSTGSISQRLLVNR
jgi:hypothetical protein